MGTSTTASSIILPSQRLSRTLVSKRGKNFPLLAARGPSSLPPHRTLGSPDQLGLLKGPIEHYTLSYSYTKGDQALAL